MEPEVKHNKLLTALLAFSLGLHGLLLADIAARIGTRPVVPEASGEIEYYVLEPVPAAPPPVPVSKESPPPLIESEGHPETEPVPVPAEAILTETAPAFESMGLVTPARLAAAFPVPDIRSEVTASPGTLFIAESSSGTPEPETPAEDSGDGYYEEVRRKIELRKKYPYAALRRKVEGQVEVSFTINSDGGISGLALARGSGSRILDREALDAVSRAAPFSPPPGRLSGLRVPLEITIVFKLM